MQIHRALNWLRIVAAVAPIAIGLTTLTASGSGEAQTLTKMKAGMVTGIDQVGLPIALERGFFEKNGLDVTVARPYATGVDALNALQAGESEIVQVDIAESTCIRSGQVVGIRGKHNRATIG